MKIINSHTHLFKRSSHMMPKGDIDDLRKDMKKAEVSKSVVFGSTEFGEYYEYSFDELIELTKKDEMFELVYTVNIGHNLDKQLEIFQDFVRKKNVCGLKILLGYYSIMPYDERLTPFYELCLEYGLPVIFHTGDPVSYQGRVKYSHPLNIDELAATFPDLKIVMAHVGNPWMTDAAEVLYKNPNVYGDLSGLGLKEDLDDDRYMNFLRKKLNDLIAFASGDKLLFGTDFPLVSTSEYIEFVKSLNLTEEEKKSLFYRNAEKLFGI